MVVGLTKDHSDWSGDMPPFGYDDSEGFVVNDGTNLPYALGMQKRPWKASIRRYHWQSVAAAYQCRSSICQTLYSRLQLEVWQPNSHRWNFRRLCLLREYRQLSSMALKVSASILLCFERYFADMRLQTINAENAGALDKDLMTVGAFSIDQLMELAGLSVSQAGAMALCRNVNIKLSNHTDQSTEYILPALGEEYWSLLGQVIMVSDSASVVGSLSDSRYLGGDGLVAARHLWHYGYTPTIFFPKQGKNELYQRLATQLKNLDIPFTDDFESALKDTDHVVDSIFGIRPIEFSELKISAKISQVLASLVRSESLLAL